MDSAQNTNKLLSIAAMLWLLSAVTYLLSEAITAGGFPGYSYARNYISDLGVPYHSVFMGREQNSTLAPLMNYGGFILHGILFALAGLVALPALPARGKARFLLILFALAHLAGSILIAVVHSGEREVANGTYALHLLGATLSIGGGNLAVLMFGKQMRGLVSGRVYSYLTYALLASAGLGILLLLAMPISPLAGAFERGCVYSIIFWELLTGCYLTAWALHQRRPPDPTKQLIGNPAT